MSKIITKLTLYKRKLFAISTSLFMTSYTALRKRISLEVFIFRIYEIESNNTNSNPRRNRFSKCNWLHKNFLQHKNIFQVSYQMYVIVLLQAYLCISSWANKTILRRIHFFKKYYICFCTYSMYFEGLSFKSSWLLTSPSTYWSWPRFISTYVFQIEYIWQR